MSNDGYYLYPTIHGDRIVFCAEDDLWSVSASGGLSARLTSSKNRCSRPAISPDGKWLAFTSQEEAHPEVFVMPAAGGEATRITYLGADATLVIGWTPDSKNILFASTAGEWYVRQYHVYAVPRAGGAPKRVPCGPAVHVSNGPKGAMVIGRHTLDPARWKRYRGGTVGDLWIDRDGKGQFEKLVDRPANLARPLWVGRHIYYLSDEEGTGNLYRCTPTGRSVERCTDHEDFYARNPATDGQRIVYHAGGDLYVFDPKDGESRKVAVEHRSPRGQRQRRPVPAAHFLTDFDLHPDGHSLALSIRGKTFTMGSWEGPVRQSTEPDGIRERKPCHLGKGDRLVLVSDADGEERLEIVPVDPTEERTRLAKLDIGRVRTLEPAPDGKKVLLTNQRQELIVVDLSRKSMKVLDRSKAFPIAGASWSPDGRYIAYGIHDTMKISTIKIAEVSTGKIRPVTSPVYHDFNPSFDPSGKYLYFVSAREFNPMYDALQFELGFPRGMRPFLVTLTADQPSPFVRRPDESSDDDKKKDKDDSKDKKDEKDETPKVKIDFEGIEQRVIPFPVPEGRYGRMRGGNDKVFFTQYSLPRSEADEDEDEAGAVLFSYDLKERELTAVAFNVWTFRLSSDAKTLAFTTARGNLHVGKAGEPIEEDEEDAKPGRKSGWVDLDRVRLWIDPAAEWRQMFDEAWRLQRDQFWVADMSRVDWKKVHARYRPLVDRIGCRAELSDLLWETQGELATSHCYEMGGDYRPPTNGTRGFLAADLTWVASSKGYRVDDIVRGDSWRAGCDSPLAAPGINVHPGDVILAINGRRLTAETPPESVLVDQAGQEVELTVRPKGKRSTRTVTVRALTEESPARYRAWVEENRRKVHQATRGRVGYVHIPDMGPDGFSEFHRGYLLEAERCDALIIDVRFNRGGHVSQLLLEKLARKRIGYDVSRYGDVSPYPEHSVAGPMVALTNEYAGSDGDIFSHAWKLHGLGPLIGKRTWGGVIGIWPRHALVDGTVTTQPEFSTWFIDVGWDVENYGTDPDIVVEITPQEAASGKDPQLDRGIAEIQELLKQWKPARLPDMKKRPNLAAPRLSRRKK
ncbi:MAG: PDZ domain-containing protein [Planctomycetota bacterium]